jgi:hypothetical protein
MEEWSAHPRATSCLQEIKVVFFPAYCTSLLQTPDLSIINSLKSYYQKQLMRKADDMTGGELLHDATSMALNTLSFRAEDRYLLKACIIKRNVFLFDVPIDDTED